MIQRNVENIFTARMCGSDTNNKMFSGRHTKNKGLVHETTFININYGAFS